MKVYLAGAISGIDWEEAVGWRQWVTKELAQYGIHALDPTRAKERNRHPEIDSECNPWRTIQGLVRRDMFDVQRADMVLMYLDDVTEDPGDGYVVSIGSMVELGWASAWQKPVIGVRRKHTQNMQEHPFLTELVTVWAETCEHAIKLIKEMRG